MCYSTIRTYQDHQYPSCARAVNQAGEPLRPSEDLLPETQRGNMGNAASHRLNL